VPIDVGVWDWAALIGSACLLFAFAMTGRRLTRGEGFVLLSIYVAYVGYLLMR